MQNKSRDWSNYYSIDLPLMRVAADQGFTPTESFINEKARLDLDRLRFGDEDSGEHRGVWWLMKRPRGLNWCGYLQPDKPVCTQLYKQMDEFAHGGFSACFGIDCAHAGDFTGLPKIDGGIFRDHEFVSHHLCRLIDMLLDGPRCGACAVCQEKVGSLQRGAAGD
jgi:hypothetical protein